ncbi:IS3 family transposase [Oceanimonas sp. CHS3-5]|uniref:IS3 family transposase n=1 Tax=Oceanimonas sp. CHS3-5 TaxID=3068186 RepID=UPI003532576F
MPAYKNQKKTRQYTNEFKVRAVRLTHLSGASVKGVAESLDIHPFMLSRWRKEYREGKIVADKRRKAESKPKVLSENERIRKLEKQVADLKEENDLLKKATVSRGGTQARFQFVAQHRARYGVRCLCRFLKVSASGFYAWLQRKTSQRDQANAELIEQIKRVFTASRETYGSPRVHQALKRQGIHVGRKRVERLMREAGLKARVARVYRKVAGLHRFYQKSVNLRKDQPKPTAPNQHWTADLTYIRVGSRWLYLAAVIDLYSRRVVGWLLGKRKTVSLTQASLQMALRNRRPEPGLIFHTDRGVEYRAHELQRLLIRHGIRASTNRPGMCTDNAEMESFFHTLKGELIKENRFHGEMHLRDKLAGYIQHFYNRFRLHSSLNYMSPVEYEALVA